MIWRVFDIPSSVSLSSVMLKGHSHGVLYESMLLFRLEKEPSVWASPEIMESTEKVQARILVKRGS